MLFLLVIAVLGLLHTAEGCTCVFAHPQSQFCAADYAIVGTPIAAKYIPFQGESVTVDLTNSETINAGNWQYILYIIEICTIYKGVPPGTEFINILTAGNSAACGVTLMETDPLKPPQKWFLSGRIDEKGFYRVGLCNWYSPYADLSLQQRFYLDFNNYKDNCDCTIKYCNLQGQCSPPDGKGCDWTAPQSRTDPFYQTKYCNFCPTSYQCEWEFVNVNPNFYKRHRPRRVYRPRAPKKYIPKTPKRNRPKKYRPRRQRMRQRKNNSMVG